ncbi:NAD-binding lipoprotein [Streptomyces sp. NPDC002588]|uniref:CASTOR/POLLUX-related putative ion channel n=1 Tax=Streptomyces sp. NPDC002588 TaxID=3154419 RepID=UPI003331E9D1
MAAEERRQASARDRARYVFDTTLARSTGTLLGWLAVCCLAVVVPVSTLLVWTDPNAPRSLPGRLTAVWRTSTETLRLGGATGAPLRMLLSALLGLIALLCVSTLVGVITTGLGERVAELRRGRSTVLESGHAVVLGWSEQIYTVVGELAAARAGRAQTVIAVLADRDPTEMETALRTRLRVPDDVRLVCRTGSPADPERLGLVTPAAAASVLLLPSERPDADLEVVRVLLALRTVLDGETGPPVLAALRDGRYLPAARRAAGPRGTVLETDPTTAHLLVQSARRPGLSAALRDLLDFAGAEFHVVDAPEQEGSTFAEVALRYERASVVGLLPADGRPRLTPAPGTVLAPGDRLVVVAHDETPGAAVDCGDHVDRTAAAAPGPRSEGPARMLLLGWNRRAPSVVEVLRRTARPGSVLHVLTDPEAKSVPRLPTADAPSGGRLDVVHHIGDPLCPDALRALDVFGHDRVLVLGPEPGAGPERPDDWVLLALLTLRSLEEETGRTLPVVAELRDSRNRDLAPLGPASDVVVRGELAALLLAQISHHPALAAVFEEIFAVRGGALTLRSADHYVRPGRETSFATVVAAALDRGECAIGYRRHGPHTVTLCPDKTERRVWTAEDEVLVLTKAPDGTGRGLPGMRRGQASDLGILTPEVD